VAEGVVVEGHHRAQVRFHRPVGAEPVMQVVRRLVIYGAHPEQEDADHEDHIERQQQPGPGGLAGSLDILLQQVVQDDAGDRDRQHRVEVEHPRKPCGSSRCSLRLVSRLMERTMMTIDNPVIRTWIFFIALPPPSPSRALTDRHSR
jgi:hypothetical protein